MADRVVAFRRNSVRPTVSRFGRINPRGRDEHTRGTRSSVPSARHGKSVNRCCHTLSTMDVEAIQMPITLGEQDRLRGTAPAWYRHAQVPGAR
jgi:hypothetical protein